MKWTEFVRRGRDSNPRYVPFAVVWEFESLRPLVLAKLIHGVVQPQTFFWVAMPLPTSCSQSRRATELFTSVVFKHDISNFFFESQCPPMNYGLEGRCLLASRRGFEPQWLEWAQWAEFFTLLRPINKLSKHVMFFINQQCSELSPPCPLSPSSSTM